MEFFHKATNFPFMGTRKIWYTLSAVLVIGFLVSFSAILGVPSLVTTWLAPQLLMYSLAAVGVSLVLGLGGFFVGKLIGA